MKASADKVGALVSIGCMIHCILTPVLLPLLPNIGFVFNHEPIVHQILTYIIIAVAAIAFLPGYVKHKKILPSIFALVGILIIAAMGVLETEVPNNIWITLGTISGSCLLVTGHYLNHKGLCACNHHGEPHCH